MGSSVEEKTADSFALETDAGGVDECSQENWLGFKDKDDSLAAVDLVSRCEVLAVSSGEGSTLVGDSSAASTVGSEDISLRAATPLPPGGGGTSPQFENPVLLDEEVMQHAGV
ncbi:AP2 domain-containing protein [Besnoitia besnoiti]|uniref:AP2 domain-containing protein n=1 Tax=Besnoitia besnoiti TaxID=94643 RepID=A0A2A9MHN9_BESBE|nr:AP2 domain-containing protein [Besnoitia besnoiti]PFH34930.1 AP2 domain-containing protein [Besnoitia besnoiti]